MGEASGDAPSTMQGREPTTQPLLRTRRLGEISPISDSSPYGAADPPRPEGRDAVGLSSIAPLKGETSRAPTPLTHPNDVDLLELERRLCDHLRQLGSVVVALSGGVDSALIATLAARELGSQALAVTGISPSLSAAERTNIEQFCRDADIAHIAVQTDEMTDPSYVANNPDRCFHCKQALFSRLAAVARQKGFAHVVDGTHADDLLGHRPGLRAAELHGVRSPLVEVGARKADVRALAKRLGLYNAARPSSPCLSSRLAYGVEVTPERLERVGRAEAFLKDLGFDAVRVRLHGPIARVEVPTAVLANVVESAPAIVTHLRELGFTYVTLDLGGLRSGSLLEVFKDTDPQQ